MEWDMDDETLRALGGERLTVTLDVTGLVPGTYVYLDANDEIIMRGAILDAEDVAPGTLLAGAGFDEDEDTITDSRTIVGPLLTPRVPGPVTAKLPEPSKTVTVKGLAIQPRRSAPISNEINDDDDIGGRTVIGPLIKPRRPAPAKGNR